MTEPSSSVIVEIADLRKIYLHEGKQLEVLQGVNLTIFQGEMISIVGRSGAGKSTLLQLMGTLDRPSSGKLRIHGKETTAMSSTQLAVLRNETIGFVFQFHHLLPEFTALENVMMPGMIHGSVSRSELTKRATELLTEVNLSHRLTHRPSELSGGEQQRVALARALVMKPKLLLADEPTGNLDSANSAQMNELFLNLNKNYGTTMVIVTHNETLASSVPRVVTLQDGQIIRDQITEKKPEKHPELDKETQSEGSDSKEEPKKVW